MASERVALRQESYTSHPTITMSDHRPVSAEFALEVSFGFHAQLQTLRFAGWLRSGPVLRDDVRLSVKLFILKNCLWF